MDMILAKPPRHKDTIERIFRPGLTATVDHVRRTISVEYHRICQETFDEATKLVERFALKGYENR